MPYNPGIKAQAKTLAKLGATAKADNFHGIYNAILNEWFPPSEYYAIEPHDPRKSGRKSFVVCHYGGHHDHPLLVVVLKRPAKWNDAGKQEVLEHLTESMQAQFDEAQYNTIYGLGGIGLQWMVCKMERDGLLMPTTVLDWHDDISSDLSCNAFEAVAASIHDIR